MMRFIILCLALTTNVLSSKLEEFEIDNLIELDEEPYQIATFPYPYQGSRMNWVYKPTVIKEKTDVVKAAPASQRAVVKTGLILSSVSYMIQVLKSAVVCFFNNGPALLIGSVLAFGVCQLKSLCSAKTLRHAEQELRSWASTDRFKSAAEFLEEAITKYTIIQNV